jgi:hypothetical protein
MNVWVSQFTLLQKHTEKKRLTFLKFWVSHKSNWFGSKARNRFIVWIWIILTKDEFSLTSIFSYLWLEETESQLPVKYYNTFAEDNVIIWNYHLPIVVKVLGSFLFLIYLVQFFKYLLSVSIYWELLTIIWNKILKDVSFNK